jgi:hypothetical protein
LGRFFSFDLNEPATVTFAFTRNERGHRVGKKCLPGAKRKRPNNGGGGRCKRTINAGTLSFSMGAGPHHVHFDGVLSRHKRLRSGRYALSVTALAGIPSATHTLHFKIVAR